MARIKLTDGQSEIIKQHLFTDELKSIIIYKSGRLEAEFIEPESGLRYRVDLTPERARQLPKAYRWTPFLLAGGIAWIGFWLLVHFYGLLALPPIIIAVNVVLGLGATIVGVVLAEKQLGTPLLLSSQQSRMLQRYLVDSAVLHSIAGGGGMAVMGSGDLVIGLGKENEETWYLVAASGTVRQLSRPAA